jgi:MoaA/NifB/PqqE/SkfB family radical SAM enzyme
MNSPTIEIGYGCNMACSHCMIGKQGEQRFMDVGVFRTVIRGLQDLGFGYVGLTASGELLLHPQLEAMLEFLARRNMKAELLTNGWWFRERLLPLLKHPRYRAVVAKIGFSLDGPDAEIHDANRRAGGFSRVMEGVAACTGLGIPVFLKSAIRRANCRRIRDMILLSASLGIERHRFITPIPVPQSIREDALPGPAEVRTLKQYLDPMSALTGGKVLLEGWMGDQSSPLHPCNPFFSFSVDAEGYLLLCGILAYIGDEEGRPLSGPERVADLKEVPLAEAIRLHWRRVADVMEWRLGAKDLFTAGDFQICYWCYYQMGKLGWLKNHPESPWAAGVLRAEKLGIAPMR